MTWRQIEATNSVPTADTDWDDALLWVRWNQAYLEAQLILLQLRLHLKYSPTQPRVPAGNGRFSGQWTGDGNVRLAQSREPFISRPAPRVRIGGTIPDLSPREELELTFAQEGRDYAVRQTQRQDPSYKPPLGFYSSVNGLISHLNSQRDDAELYLLNLNRALDGLPPLERSRLYDLTTPSLRNTPTEEIFAPGGQLVGTRYLRAGTNIQTVDRQTFEELVLHATYGSRALPGIPGYTGVWYSRGDTCVLGFRYSRNYGPTIDVIQHGPYQILEDVKVHVR